jgi:hypothetical protein
MPAGTHLRVYSVRKDSKNGCNSGGVAASAVLMNSSSTSFDGFELSVDMVAVGGESTYTRCTPRFHFIYNDVTRRLRFVAVYQCHCNLIRYKARHSHPELFRISVVCSKLQIQLPLPAWHLLASAEPNSCLLP